MPLQDSFSSFSRRSDKPDEPHSRAPRAAKWPRVPTVEDLDFSFQRAKDSPGFPAAMSWKRTEQSNFVISCTWEVNNKAGEATWVMQAEEMGDAVVLWSFRSRDAQVIHKLMEEGIASLEPIQEKDSQEDTGQDKADKSDKSSDKALARIGPGTIIDHYEIIEEIGSGGMGVVFRGRDQMFDRPVAVKVLHSKLMSDPLSKKRFEQEGRATIALAHPNLISVYHYGFWNGSPFIVMEYVDGKGLDKLLDYVGHIEIDEFVDIFLQACDALGHAHEKGIIHRDLKPSNFMIVENGRKKERLVKIVDFGISKILPSGRITGQDLTNAGDVIGSPLYMSPEQCKGLALDGRSDIYSLGCLMYQAVSGALPFLGENALQTLSKHICDPPPPFNDVVPSLKIPDTVQAVIFAAMEKEPEHRFQNVADLREALEELNPKAKSLSLTTTTLSKVTSAATAGSVHILVEADALPRATLEAAVQVQMWLKEGRLTLTQAADALKEAHVRGGKIDVQPGPAQTSHGLVVDTPIEAVLVEAGLISNAVWRTLLQLQSAIRNQEMTKEDAVLEFKKRHQSSKSNQDTAVKKQTVSSPKVDMVMPADCVALLKQSGIITQADLDRARDLAKDDGTKLERHLVTLGIIDTKTVLAAYQCLNLLSQGKIELGQAIIALNFCQRSRVDFNEAIEELGWNLG